jgi:hypothetical protein
VVGRKGRTRNWLIIASPPAGGQVIDRRAKVTFTFEIGEMELVIVLLKDK